MPFILKIIKTQTFSSKHFKTPHPGLLLAVHRHCGILKEHIYCCNSDGFHLAADPDIRNNTEPLLGVFVAHRGQLKCPLSFNCSGHAVKGAELANWADAAVSLFDVTTPDPVSYVTNLATGAGQLLTLYQP